MHRLFPILTICAMATISCQKENATAESPRTPAPAPLPLPAPLPVANADISIASVTLLEDCPDAADDNDSAGASMDMEEGYVQPCRQATMQIAITGQRDASASFAIKEVRLLGPDDAVLGIVKAREPSLWSGSGYAAWDQRVVPGPAIKASYKLSLGDWNSIEKALGKNSYGPLFVIEADIAIGATPLTIRSGKVAREPTEMVDT
tara:strand:- start:5726 stop:6340 length:615 start_codon:yes stop_codon:yes gene_type:complete